MNLLNRRKTKHPESGFTIVEIIVVIVLMTFVLYPAARVIVSALQSSTEEQYLTHAAFLAQLKIEQVRAGANCYESAASSYPGCPMGGDPKQDFKDDFSQTAAQCSFPAPFSQYECIVSDNWGPGGMHNKLKMIQVWVWYDKNSNGTRELDEPQVYLETQLTGRPPYNL